MRPTTPELIDAIATVLRDRIAPAVSDQPWIASELRTVDALLALILARVEHEATVLAADNADLEPLLHHLAKSGIGVTADERPAHETDHSWNTTLRAELEAAIHLLHDGTHYAEVQYVRNYLVRSAQREQVLYDAMTKRRLF